MGLVLLVAAVLAGLAVTSRASAADRNFAPRFAANDTGDIDIFGNTLMTCPSSASGCAAAQQAGVTTTASSTTQNNAYNMQYIDVDGDSSTFNSSRSTVSLPAGSQVLFAGLYWGARTAAGSGGSAARNANARNLVKLKAPGASGYTQLTADRLDDGTGGIYQGFVDVTDEVKAAGDGRYTVADVQASTGADTLAGWSLVVAYRDTTQPARNLSVFDGIKSISSGASGTISVSGFTTPPAGDVRTRVGFVTYEGDGGIVGDSASLNGRTLSDAEHPATNFFNSRASRDGVRRAVTSPNYSDPTYPNQLGIEQSILKADGYLGNSATSATIGLTSSGDVYAPGVVTFATELYAPKVDQTKTVTDLDGGAVEQGDVLRYTISGANSGQDGATSFVLRDPLPTNTTYVANSLKLSPTTGGSTTSAVTDATGDDRGEYDGANRRIVARLGTGSTATAGGTLAIGATYTTTFDVRVNGPSPAVASDTVISNVATASFASQSLGTPLTAQSTADATVRSPDLTITKTGAGTVVRGAPYRYAIAVRNAGDAKTQGTVTVTDTLPTGLAFRGTTPVTGAGWACTTTTATFTCTRSDALAAGSSYPSLTLDTDVAPDAPATIANTATVSGGGDGNPANNTGTATNNPSSSADLAVVKNADVTSVAVGGDVTYTLKVTNNGTSDSTGSVLTDTLPSGLTYVSSDAPCTGAASASAVTCPVGALPAGSSTSFTVVAKPARGTAGTPLTNTVSVSGNEPDPTPGNNTSSSTVDVKPVDLKITSTLQGDPATLSPNTSYTWVVGVTNQGGSPATGSVVRFDVPAGTTVDTGLDSRCTVASSVITCDLGTIAPGATVTPLQIPLKTTANPPASVDTVASVATTENDIDLGNNTAKTSTPVISAVDLGVTIKAGSGTASAADTLTLIGTIANNGPATPQSPSVTFPIPAGTTFVSAPAGCALNGDGTAVVCVLDPADLTPGNSVDRAIIVKVGDDPPAGGIVASATVKTTSNDTDPSNDTAQTTVPVVTLAGVSITKTASATQAKPGDAVGYTLTAKNAGPAAAKDVVIDDVLPAGTTFVSADAPCAFDDGKVRCALDDHLAAGASKAVHVTIRVSALAGSFDANATHLLDVQKNETDLPIEANTNGSAVASCPAGYLATDGSARLESVDQGTGDFRDLAVRSSRATSDGTGWYVSVDNSATGRAELKVTVACLKTTTTDAGSGHAHPLLVSDPVTSTRALTAGRQEVVLTCGPGRVAIAPSYAFAPGGAATIRGSQRQGITGWKFTVDIAEADDATFFVRCLSTTTGATDGHVHDLGLAQLSDTVVVPGGQTGSQKTTETVTCQDSKGIVGGSLLPNGLTSAGNDPQPVSRIFGFQNTTPGDLTAHVSLLCLGLRTGGELGFANVTNTATVKTSTQDATTSDDAASATFTATPASGDTGTIPQIPTPTPPVPFNAPAGPAPDPAVAPTPGPTTTLTAKASILSSALRVTGTAFRATVSVPVRCAKACTGTAKLVATSALRSAGIKKGAVLATASVKLTAGKKSTLRLVAKGKVAKALKRGGVTRAKLVVSTGKGKQVTKTVRLVLR